MGILFQINSNRDYSVAEFYINYSEQSMWEEILKNLPSPTSPDAVHYFKKYFSENKLYFTIKLFSTYEICLQIFKTFQNYAKLAYLPESPQEKTYDSSYLGYESEEDFRQGKAFAQSLASDKKMPKFTTVSYDTRENQSYEDSSSYDDNGENQSYEDTSNYDDNWVDYGYMNDINNPYEVY